MSEILNLLSSSISNNLIQSKNEIDESAQFPIADPTIIRYPQIVYTDDYLNDPITFSSSIRFYDETVIPQLPSGSDVYNRDLSHFIAVTVNNSRNNDQFFPVMSRHYVVSRQKFIEIIDFTFTEFVPDSSSVLFFKEL